MSDFKKPITYVLAVFLVMSIFVMASKAIIESAKFDEEDLDRLAEKITERLGSRPSLSNVPRRENYVTVYYLHGEPCPTCETMEFLAHKTLEDHFAEQVASGRVVWEAVDYREKENQSLAKRFDVVTSTLLLTRHEDGEITAHENLVEIWDLYNQPDRYIQYVRKELAAFLEETNDGEPPQKTPQDEPPLIEPSHDLSNEEAEQETPLPGLP
jgi:thiol-disulfide isomerase/thioredoxin